ncbi:DUF2306 domain-containing protein [Gordonia jinghuaiqii]|uniref:DUF2306 domain-containing protein n=1 Tax=Gordonia jinghuaiqii TaxID=2758710 RepID=A0A7D7QGK6_9ACTN|nr:DUF2306 domain-containing protein [Gordonia jinghuaiqii]QMT00484.1 DUF2306 domain-containing protein [Gordonia jinghuaiqii]
MKKRVVLAWMVFAVVVAMFVVFAVYPYVTLSPERSRLPVSGQPGWYYPLVVVHVAAAAVAMVCAAGQLWTARRGRHRLWHRIEGRTYVGAVAVAGPSAFAIGLASPFGPSARVSNVVLAVLWVTFTVAGLRAIRGGDVAGHRRWMTRSACLAFSIVLNRVFAIVFSTVLAGWLENGSTGVDDPLATWVPTISTWLGLVSGLMVGQFVSDRAEDRRRRRAVGNDWGVPVTNGAHAPATSSILLR